VEQDVTAFEDQKAKANNNLFRAQGQLNEEETQAKRRDAEIQEAEAHFQLLLRGHDFDEVLQLKKDKLLECDEKLEIQSPAGPPILILSARLNTRRTVLSAGSLFRAMAPATTFSLGCASARPTCQVTSRSCNANARHGTRKSRPLRTPGASG
jgi:hypothetical protein